VIAISHAPFFTARATMLSVRKPENIFGCTLMMSIFIHWNYTITRTGGYAILLA